MTPPPRPHNPTPADADRIRNEAAEINRRFQRHLPRHVSQRVANNADREAAALQQLATAEARRKAQRWAEALSLAEAACGLAPLNSMAQADAFALVGELRLEQGNHQAARAAFEQALQIAPAHLAAHTGLAAAYRRSQRADHAVPLYLEAIALTDNESQRRHLRGLLAETYREMGKADLARELLLTVAPPAEPNTVQTLLLPASRNGWLRWAVAALVALALWRLDHPWWALLIVGLAMLWPLLRVAGARLRDDFMR
ncbi:MAG: tetratricopeptide repeat protein [Anaerolineales bacterium]|nr:tetratricopeptide repeat protein [Anaerolineales bacterium]MCB9128696.1 tetratricopeptide repeat protein [Ardenticatenales bacterium]MCB9172606.1 tetratricopeptide repeat protein [Ardenticatenales bacterium]